MRIEVSEKNIVFTIFDIPRLDPVTVVLQDIALGNGRLIVECYGEVWTGYWGGMGDRTVIDFILNCSPDYILNRISPSKRRMKKSEEAYLLRIVTAVQDALRSSVSAGV